MYTLNKNADLTKFEFALERHPLLALACELGHPNLVARCVSIAAEEERQNCLRCVHVGPEEVTKLNLITRQLFAIARLYE